MGGVSSRAAFAGPERIYETELLARVEDLSSSFVHCTEDFGGSIDGNEIVLTPSLVPWPWREGTEMILHRHGESPKIVIVSLAQGDIDEDVHRTINQVF